MSRREDHYAWTLGTARALRAGEVAFVDLRDVAEELEQMGRSDAHELESRVMQIMEHLVQLEFTTGVVREYNQRGWRASISRQRREIGLLLRRSPSLKSELTADLLQECYKGAAETVATEFPEVEPPEHCPFGIEDVVNRQVAAWDGLLVAACSYTSATLHSYGSDSVCRLS